MEAAAAAMLEAGVGRFHGPSLAALLAEIWAPLAVALAALATLPSLLGRLQVLILRLRSRGKELMSSGDSDSDSDSDSDDSSDDAATGSSGEEEPEPERRIRYFDGAAEGPDGCFPWGGAVVRTWQGLPLRFSCAGVGTGARFASGSGGGTPAVRLWGAGTASGEGAGQGWSAVGDSSCRNAEATVVVGWRREHEVRF